VKQARVEDATSGADEGRPFGLVSVERTQAPHFLATGGRFRIDGSSIHLPPDVRKLLRVAPGESVGVVPV
jgi:hypothetical protein